MSFLALSFTSSWELIPSAGMSCTGTVVFWDGILFPFQVKLLFLLTAQGLQHLCWNLWVSHSAGGQILPSRHGFHRGFYGRKHSSCSKAAFKKRWFCKVFILEPDSRWWLPFPRVRIRNMKNSCQKIFFLKPEKWGQGVKELWKTEIFKKHVWFVFFFLNGKVALLEPFKCLLIEIKQSPTTEDENGIETPSRGSGDTKCLLFWGSWPLEIQK